MATNREILIAIKTSSDMKAIINAKHNLTELSRSGVNVAEHMKAVDQGLKNAEISAVSATKAFKKFRFQGLNIMFFGMFLQRTFQGITTSGVDAFRKITESGEGFGSALTAISAETQFLQFTLGEALNTVLEPFLPLIINLVTAIADFVQQHPEVAAIAAAIAIIGGVMMGFGAVKIFWDNMGIGMTDIKGVATDISDLLKNLEVNIIKDNLAEFQIKFMKMYDGLPKALQIAVTFMIMLAVATFFLTLGEQIGAALYEGVGKAFMEWASKNPVAAFLVKWFAGFAGSFKVLTGMQSFAQFKENQIVINEQMTGGTTKLPTPLFGEARVSRAGMMFMQPGEVITSADKGPSIGAININVVGGGADGRALAKMISEEIASQIRNVASPSTRFG